VRNFLNGGREPQSPMPPVALNLRKSDPAGFFTMG
jgi:hypothetical protein